MKKGIVLLLGVLMAVLAGCQSSGSRDPEVRAYLESNGFGSGGSAKPAAHHSKSKRRAARRDNDTLDLDSL